jgi:hypothetical protein
LRSEGKIISKPITYEGRVSNGPAFTCKRKTTISLIRFKAATVAKCNKEGDTDGWYKGMVIKTIQERC